MIPLESQAAADQPDHSGGRPRSSRRRRRAGHLPRRLGPQSQPQARRAQRGVRLHRPICRRSPRQSASTRRRRAPQPAKGCVSRVISPGSRGPRHRGAEPDRLDGGRRGGERPGSRGARHLARPGTDAWTGGRTRRRRFRRHHRRLLQPRQSTDGRRRRRRPSTLGHSILGRRRRRLGRRRPGRRRRHHGHHGHHGHYPTATTATATATTAVPVSQPHADAAHAPRPGRARPGFAAPGPARPARPLAPASPQNRQHNLTKRRRPPNLVKLTHMSLRYFAVGFLDPPSSTSALPARASYIIPSAVEFGVSELEA